MVTSKSVLHWGLQANTLPAKFSPSKAHGARSTWPNYYPVWGERQPVLQRHDILAKLEWRLSFFSFSDHVFLVQLKSFNLYYIKVFMCLHAFVWRKLNSKLWHPLPTKQDGIPARMLMELEQLHYQTEDVFSIIQLITD